AADHQWFDRHFLPSFFLPRHWYVVMYTCVRWTIVVLGISFAVGGPVLVARLTSRTWAHVVLAVAAAALALGASELVLQRVHLRSAEWLLPEEEPRRRADSRLGWTFVPSRTGYTTARPPIEYALDAAGYRVRRVD